MYPLRVPGSRVLLTTTFGVVTSIALALGCGPRSKGPAGPTQQPVVASVPTAAAPPPAPTGTAPAPPQTAWTIPGLQIPGLPVSPRQAMLGKWAVSSVDGKPVATAPGMATDPMDPASYVAGTTVTFTPETVLVQRVGFTLVNRPYKVVSELPPIRVTIDAGYGPSNVDFSIDGTAIWSLPSTPPHAVTLTRTQ